MKETALLASLVVLCGYYALFALVFGWFHRAPVEPAPVFVPAEIRVEKPVSILKPKTAYWTAKPPSSIPAPDVAEGD